MVKGQLTYCVRWISRSVPKREKIIISVVSWLALPVLMYRWSYNSMLFVRDARRAVCSVFGRLAFIVFLPFRCFGNRTVDLPFFTLHMSIIMYSHRIDANDRSSVCVWERVQALLLFSPLAPVPIFSFFPSCGYFIHRIAHFSRIFRTSSALFLFWFIMPHANKDIETDETKHYHRWTAVNTSKRQAK